MKKKISAALAFALALVLLAAVAIAAANRAGLLDFIGRYSNSYVPQDAQTYVQTDVATAENELVTATVREMYYDGKVSRLVVEVTPKSPATLLLGEDMAPSDPWENMLLHKHAEGEADLRTAAQVYQSGGYEAAYAANYILRLADETVHRQAGTMDYCLNEDGSLTIYQQEEYQNAPETMEATLELLLLPWETPLTEESQLFHEQRTELCIPLRLTQTGASTESYLCTQPVELPSVGVRIDGLLIEVKPQEIYATLDFTVIDRAAYDALDNGLWFEFIDPDSTADTPYGQRLKGGLTGSGAISPTDTDDLSTALHYRQTETLGRNELHQTYTIRAYDVWEKERFETVRLTVEPVTAEEAAAFLKQAGESAEGGQAEDAPAAEPQDSNG